LGRVGIHATFDTAIFRPILRDALAAWKGSWRSASLITVT
jgi:hypothetical protein